MTDRTDRQGVCAPIAVFAYNRPRHLAQTIEALRNNPEAGKSELYVFSDGARNEPATDPVAAVRQYVRQVSGFSAVHIVERPENYGLGRSIIEGVTGLCAAHGRVIVVEDDIVTSPHFLKFMNDGLNCYAHDERVISIHGYQFPVSGALPESFFLRGADCWGWATWKRGWDLFEPDGRRLLEALETRRLTHRFDLDGAYPYTRMLKRQIEGRNDSWAIRWHASAFLHDKLTLYPGRSLVRNIGTDGTGRHCAATGAYTGAMAELPVAVGEIPVEESALARDRIVRFHRASRPSIARRAVRKLAGIANRLS